jgi:hypothetical protein
MRPDVAIVIVDCDADRQRKQTLLEHIQGLTSTTVVGVAIQEFESWLVADVSAGRDACDTQGFVLDEPPESLAPSDAKTRLETCLAMNGANLATIRQRRCSIAERCDLTKLEQRCPSFVDFATDLITALPR